MNKAGEKITKDVSPQEIRDDGLKTVGNACSIAAALTAIALAFGVVATDARLGNDNEGYSDLSMTQRAGFVAGEMAAKAEQVMTGDPSARNAVADQVQNAVRKAGPRIDF